MHFFLIFYPRTDVTNVSPLQLFLCEPTNGAAQITTRFMKLLNSHCTTFFQTLEPCELSAWSNLSIFNIHRLLFELSKLFDWPRWQKVSNRKTGPVQSQPQCVCMTTVAWQAKRLNNSEQFFLWEWNDVILSSSSVPRCFSHFNKHKLLPSAAFLFLSLIDS